jgi:cytochrome c oxidase cbb3-type subunit II
MDIFNNHKKLFGTATALFVVLTLFVAIFPAINNQDSYQPLPNSKALTFEEMEGKKIYIENGCVACHTQQVRNVDMDKMWGERPGIAADYARNERMSLFVNTATLMGTERTGPDLTNIGTRQPSLDWHLLHLFQPRAAVGTSIMPAYPWLFDIKKVTNKEDVIVNLPEPYSNQIEGQIVASQKALYLVAYLQSLKQVALPSGSNSQEFLYKKEEKSDKETTSATETLPNGEELYSINCMSCHQPNGKGLPGAFPPLANSKIVLDDNIELMVRIIMQGYNPREEYAVMPAVGTNNNLTAEEITAIMNHEKTSWGNNAKKTTAQEVKKIMDLIKNESK